MAADTRKDDPKRVPRGRAKGAPGPPKRPARPGAAKRPARQSGDATVFPIVGVGASAGGLAAVEEFFAALPDEAAGALAIVLVQHLDPDHESLLLDLVKRYTKMVVT